MESTKIAVYIRLSTADEETGRSKKESNSVVNQRSLIHHYLDNHEELSSYPRYEFVDDGFTGTNTDRPAFQKMIKGIREGKYKICITKNFSRFSRDYLEMGDYLECLFPFLKVRYISINDNYDSDDYKGTTGGLDMVMRAIIYDAYSKDLSLKVKTSQMQSMKKGRRISGDPGYGYIRDSNRTSMDVIDPEAAAIVRRIFDLAIAGVAPGKIAAKLNEDHILTPSAYFKKKHPESRKFPSVSPKQRWSYRTVYDIIRRYAYTGAAVSGFRQQVKPCSRFHKMKKTEDWIVVPDMHEAIITAEEYKLAQKVIGEDHFTDRTPKNYPLKSLVHCGNCLRVMKKHDYKSRFRCVNSFNGGDSGCRAVSRIEEEKLEHIVFDAIREYMNLVNLRCGDAKRQKSAKRKNEHADKISVAEYERHLEKLRRQKFHEYERYSSGKCSLEAYKNKKQELDEKISEYENKLAVPREQIKAAEIEDDAVSSELEAVCNVFNDEKSLTFDMAHAFVEKIFVYPDNRVEIKWRFSDFFTEREAVSS